MTRRGTREPSAEDQSPVSARKVPRFAETLRQQLRDVMNQLTGKAPAPASKKPRRRTEDTGRAAFKLAARKIMRRTVRLPAAAYAAALFTWNTLDCMNPWHYDTASHTDLDEGFHYPEPRNYLFPHP